MEKEAINKLIADHTGLQGDFVSDLNAMHEAEKVLTVQQQQVFLYLLHGAKVTYNNWNLVHTSAGQRAEAFLRTLNLWQESAEGRTL